MRGGCWPRRWCTFEDLEPDPVDLRHRSLRTKVTKGPGSRVAGLAMVFKLLQAAEEHWRYVNGAHLVALVRAGAKFENEVPVERPEQTAQEVAA